MDLKELAILGESASKHWYYRAKSAAMLRMLRGRSVRRVLDVGAGSGFFSRCILDRTAATDAVCVDPNYASEHDEDQHGKKISFVHQIERFDGDLVLMMDVLEHVPDDAALLGDYVRCASAGTRFLITVPAHRWMWSGHDVFLGHYRRYTVAEVDRLIARAGLRRLRSSYFFGLTLPLAAGSRLCRRLASRDASPARSDMKPHGWLINQALLRLSQLELPAFRLNRLAGLSVIALAEK